MIHNWKLIEFYHEHPDLIKDHPIIGIEVHGLRETEVDGFVYAEQDDDNPEYYGVYVRQQQGGDPEKGDLLATVFNPIICVADLNDLDDANDFANFLRILLKLPTDDKSSIR